MYLVQNLLFEHGINNLNKLGFSRAQAKNGALREFQSKVVLG